jgi:DNA repair exonuclease SbcCD ATPase subunit
MKNTLFLAGLLGILVSCGGPDYKAEVEKLKRDRDSILAQYDAKETEINGYMQDINDIQASINALTQQEEMLNQANAGNTEVSQDAKTKILSDVDAIRQLIENNKKKLNELQARVRRSSTKVAELEKLIASLNTQLSERDSSINELNSNISNLNTKIATVETELQSVKTDNQAKAQEIADKTTRLHTAYYTVGDYKTLRDKKVLTKEGGFLGIGKKKSVVPDFNQEAFTRIDLTNTKTIELSKVSKNIKFASTHPTGSYTLKKENEKVKAIEITNPDQFWSNSKYLVVVTD